MTHDTDPTDLTPRSIRQPPQEYVTIGEFNQWKQTVENLVGEVQTVVRLFLPDETGKCPFPQVSCQALETAEQLAKRVRYGRLWTALGSAVIMAFGGLLVAITTALTGGQARAEGKAAAIHEIESRAKSTESISYESARLGAIEGYRQCQKDVPSPPIRVH